MIYKCHQYGRPGYKSGKKGFCYLYETGNIFAENRAKLRAEAVEKRKNERKKQKIDELLGWFRGLYQ